MFGKVRSNKGLVRHIESIPTKDDKPEEPVVIAAAGVLSPEELAQAAEERKKAQEASGGEDIWEVSELRHGGYRVGTQVVRTTQPTRREWTPRSPKRL